MEATTVEAIKNNIATEMGFKSYLEYLVQYEESPFVPALEKYIQHLEESHRADKLDWDKHLLAWEQKVGSACDGYDLPDGAAKYIDGLKKELSAWKSCMQAVDGEKTPGMAAAQILKLKASIREQTVPLRMKLKFWYGIIMALMGLFIAVSTDWDNYIVLIVKSAIGFYTMYTGFKHMEKSINTYS